MEEINNTSDKNARKYKRLSIIFGIIALVLLGIIAYFYIILSCKQQEKIIAVEQQNNSLQQELDLILWEYDSIKAEFGDLNNQLTEKDSAILAQAEEIRGLIASQEDYRRIKKKLELLQNQGKEYVQLLDSLYIVNQQLTKENVEIKQTVTRLSKEKEELSVEKETLQEKVTTAARLKAYNVSLKGINLKSGGKKEEETGKAKRVKKLKVVFTLSENELFPAGEMNLYCRISLPDGKVLAPGKGDAYSFINEGKQLQYTIKTSVNYENKAKQITMEWTLRPEDHAVPGEYTAQLFTDTDYIGQAIMILQ
jgi:predicted  nucleic acid-binding Zn-ribbon protein